MGEIPSKISESASDEAARLLKLAAGSCEPGEHISSIIARAARRAGLTWGRAKTIWYREARRIDSVEMDRLRAFRTGQGQEEIEDERLELRRRIERLEEILVRLDASGARAPRAEDRAVCSPAG